MSDNRFDLGRPAGPDFAPAPPGAPAGPPVTAVRTPVAPVPNRIGPAPVEPPVPPPAPPVVAPARRPRGRTAVLVATCLLTGAMAGTGAAVVVVRSDMAPVIRQYQPAAGGVGSIPDAQTAADALLPSVVEVAAGSSRGSGFAIDDAGHIITNSHVVQGFSRVLVRLADGRQTAARVVGSDRGTDIAVLAVLATPPPAATLGVSSALRIGQPVIAVGAPLGLNSTVTAGIVSAIDRTARVSPGTQSDLRMVQTDASINPGNSGGPLANLQGQVVGMNTAIATMGGSEAGNIGIGFAVPIDHAATVARQLIAAG